MAKDQLDGETIPASDQLELLPFFQEGEEHVSGDDVIRRTASRANLGFREFHYFATHQDLLPEEWRQFRLVFAGDKQDHQVPVLYWVSWGWVNRWIWLGQKFDIFFDADYRVVCRRE